MAEKEEPPSDGDIIQVIEQYIGLNQQHQKAGNEIFTFARNHILELGMSDRLNS